MSIDLERYWSDLHPPYARACVDEAFANLKATPNHGPACFPGRGTAYMCGWYSGFDVYVAHVLREEREADLVQLARSCEHMCEQIYYGLAKGRRSSGEPISHPPGEYVHEHGSPSSFLVDNDSQISRHTGIWGLCKALAHPKVWAFIEDKPAAINAVVVYCLWLTGTAPAWSQGMIGTPAGGMMKPGDGRAWALQCRSLVGAYAFLGDYKYLELAYWFVRYHFDELDARLLRGAGVRAFYAWDNGRSGFRLGGTQPLGVGPGKIAETTVPGFTAEYTVWPWYLVDWTVSLHLLRVELGYHNAKVRKHSEIPEMTDRIQTILLRLTDWIAWDTRSIVPRGDLWSLDLGPGNRNAAGKLPPNAGDRQNWIGDGRLKNHMVHGLVDPSGTSDGGFLVRGEESAFISPSEFFAMDDDAPFHMPGTLRDWVTDGQYWAYWYPDGKVRPQHYGRFGPDTMNWPNGPDTWSLIGDGSRVADAAYIRYLLTRNEEDRRWSTVLAFCATRLAKNNGGLEIARKGEMRDLSSPPYWMRSEGRGRTWAAAPGFLAAEYESPGESRALDQRSTHAQAHT